MRRRRSLGTQLLAMQVGVVLVIVLAAGGLLAGTQQEAIRAETGDRLLLTARNLAAMPIVVAAVTGSDPAATLAPVGDAMDQAAGSAAITIADVAGMVVHSEDVVRVGRPLGVGAAAALDGQGQYALADVDGVEVLRASAPVMADGEVAGIVAVGVPVDDLAPEFAAALRRTAVWMVVAALVGLACAAGMMRVMRRRLHGLGADDIAQLLQVRQAMLHGIREGVVAVDEDGRLALLNDEARRLLDLEGRDLVGQPAVEALVDTGVEALLDADDDEVVTDRVVLVGERLVMCNRSVARIEQESVGVVLTLRDRTELFGMMRELEGQRSITDSLRAQAHGHANQMHVISGLLDLGDADRAKDYIERVGGGGEIVGGELSGRIADPSLSALLVAKGALARERGIEYTVDPETRVDHVVGDDVVAVVANLVDNATDAVAPGGSVAIRVRAVVGDDIEVVVDDDGPGVPDGIAADVFDAGVTTKAIRGHGAVGIGLALVDRIVSRRGGEVWFRPRTPRGTRFAIRLPPLPRSVTVPDGDDGRPRAGARDGGSTDTSTANLSAAPTVRSTASTVGTE